MTHVFILVEYLTQTVRQSYSYNFNEISECAYKGSSVVRPKCTISRNESWNKFLLREFALVYSGTKRSTTSEGLREAAAEDHDVRKRKENIKINNLTLTHRTNIWISKSDIHKFQKFSPIYLLWKEPRDTLTNIQR